MFKQSEKWAPCVQLNLFSLLLYLQLGLDCIFKCAFAGDLSLFSRKLPGIRSGEPSAHQPHFYWIHCRGFHRRHPAVVQQLWLPGTGASLLAASRGLPGRQGQCKERTQWLGHQEKPKQDPRPLMNLYDAYEKGRASSWETCRPLLFYCCLQYAALSYFISRPIFLCFFMLLTSAFFTSIATFCFILNLFFNKFKNVHRPPGPSVLVHNIAVYVFVFAPPLSIERFFPFSHETSRAGTVMPVSGCHDVTVVWSTVLSGMFEVSDVALCVIRNGIHAALFMWWIHYRCTSCFMVLINLCSLNYLLEAWYFT